VLNRQWRQQPQLVHTSLKHEALSTHRNRTPANPKTANMTPCQAVWQGCYQEPVGPTLGALGSRENPAATTAVTVGVQVLPVAKGRLDVLKLAMLVVDVLVVERASWPWRVLCSTGQ
jgi:hypothetical protein